MSKIAHLPLLALLVGGAYSQSVSHAGVNLFGYANDMSILGSAYSEFEGTNCNASYEVYPYADSIDQYEAWRAKGFNMFRLALGWQHVQTELGGPLNETTLSAVDELVTHITNDGNVAILDIHNYARWYCAVIGQPELSFLNPTINVTDDHFIDLWEKLAGRYANNTNVIFQLMNEPHDLDIVAWGNTNQKVINAIRKITSEQKILVSGTQFARLTNWIASSMPGIGPGLIQDPANNTLYDFHQYFDDLGGAYGLCEPWSVFAADFHEVTTVLRANGYRGIITEFGGGPFPQCVDLYNHFLSFLNRNRDVWFGWTTWGSYSPGDLYLSLDPNSTFYTLTATLEDFLPPKVNSSKV